MATIPTLPFSCFCILTTGLLLLPASLHATTALSGGAKKAPVQGIARAVGKTPVKVKVQAAKKPQLVRLHAAVKAQTTTTRKAKAGRKASGASAQQERKVAQAKAKRRSTGSSQTAAATAKSKERTRPSSVPLAHKVAQAAQTSRHTTRPPGDRGTDVQVQAGDTPFLKQKATLSACTRLAQTLQDQLGVEVLVQEDPHHSGGLFIAPPSTETGQESAAKAMDLLANLPLGKPIDASISSPFGGRQDPINGRKAFHEGVDFQAKTGDKVFATGKGRVVSSGYSPDYGENVIISHGRGYETMYAHLSKRAVQVGDSIAPGDVVGLVGNTGRSTGSHLHYEIRYRGAPINPMDYMLATQQARLQKK